MAIVERPNMGYDLASARRYRQDRERAYAEGFEEFLATSVPCDIAGQVYRLHPNINLYVDLTPACNADCAFCIAKTSYARRAVPTQVFMQRAQRVFRAVQHVNPSIQIVGGEPTISPCLWLVLESIPAYGFRLPVLGTNGAGLSLPLSIKLSQAGIRHVNLSRHHYRDDLNAEIMGSDSLPTSGQLSLLVPGLGPNIDVRLQCNLIGGYIDTYGEVMQFIAYGYHRLGVHSFAFSQLTPLPRNNIYRPEIIDYVAERQVDIDGILAGIETDSRFRFVKFRGGVACYYEVWEYTAYERPVNVVFKYSNNDWLVKADQTTGYVPDLILHTDGVLCGSWDRHCKVMIEPEEGEPCASN